MLISPYFFPTALYVKKRSIQLVCGLRNNMSNAKWTHWNNTFLTLCGCQLLDNCRKDIYFVLNSEIPFHRWHNILLDYVENILWLRRNNPRQYNFLHEVQLFIKCEDTTKIFFVKWIVSHNYFKVFPPLLIRCHPSSEWFSMTFYDNRHTVFSLIILICHSCKITLHIIINSTRSARDHIK